MSTFVLVSGAWHGGWCWDRVEPILRQAGHRVITPTLTGISDRAHLMNPAVGLDTHINDVVQLLDHHDLSDVILVGHSYAGQVITGVADQRPERLARRVYLDAFIGDGRPAIELLPAEISVHYRESVAENGFGWLIPGRSLEVLGVTSQTDLEWLTPRLTPHPWKTYTDVLNVHGHQQQVPAEFIECVDWMRVFRPYAELAASLGWPVHEIQTGHEAMVTAPDELASIFLQILESSR
ncbi:alpha/beta fold hydrolase [Paeniglutamicibacter gangotriensis]|uniref:alpha/beta fold hydrolase n=1 Tax=Paeniglutamicibacter gangotriensis TaxID=254787 RepID=UPI0037C52EBA